MTLKTQRLFYISIIVVAVGCSTKPAPPPLTSGKSEDFPKTQIVATLDTPMEPGKNVIWCATMQAMWKQLERDILKGPAEMEKPSDECDRLNAAPDPAGDLPEGAYYVAVGRIGEGIENRIQSDMKRLFPERELALPRGGGAPPDAFVGYTYLEASVHFTVPFLDLNSPEKFVDGEGDSTKVRFFGDIKTSPIDLEVLLVKESEWGDATEFALDLCKDSSPNQIVVACIEPQDTLSGTLASLETKISEWEQNKPSDIILDKIAVPEMNWDIVHRFVSLGQNVFLNDGAGRNAFAYVEQDIRFKLDKRGAELSSEAIGVAKSAPVAVIRCLANCPFLVYMKKRGAEKPFFVMWVDNAELLMKR